MNRLLAYTLSRISNLDNRKACSPGRENEMSVNKKRIRREIVISGTKMWVTADTEQEYVDKILALAGSKARPEIKHRFYEYAERWYEVFSKPNVSNVTALTYRRQLDKHIYPVLGELFLEDIVPSDVQRVFNGMDDDTKKETKLKTKMVLNQIFNMAVDDSLMQRNPFQSSSIKIKGPTAAVTEPYSQAQMRYLVSHLSDISRDMDRAWLALSISLPLRPEEVLGLKWEDIDTENCILHVRNTVTHPTRNEPEFKPYTKTAASVRDLAFPSEILLYLPERGNSTDFVIGGFNPISYTQLRGIRTRINYDTKFGETVTPRRFRTTVATDISAMTHDLKLVQKMLGHSTPQMTLKHYDKGRSEALDASKAIGACYGFAT